MKKLSLIIFAGVCFLSACRENPENGGEEVRGDEQRSDTPLNISKYPGEGDSLQYRSGNAAAQSYTSSDSGHVSGNASSNMDSAIPPPR